MSFRTPIVCCIVLTMTLQVAAVEVKVGNAQAELSNNHIARHLSIAEGHLTTSMIVNKRAGTKAVPSQCDEFRIRISKGTDKTGTDLWLTSADFEVKEIETFLGQIVQYDNFGHCSKAP